MPQLILCSLKDIYHLPFLSVLVPSVAPANIWANNISSSALNVRFENIDVEFRQGIVLGYKVFYRLADELKICLGNSSESSIQTCSKYNQTAFNGSKTIVSYDIESLEMNKNYGVCIAAFTSAGDGLVSECVYAETGFFSTCVFSQYYFSCIFFNQDLMHVMKFLKRIKFHVPCLTDLLFFTVRRTNE